MKKISTALSVMLLINLPYVSAETLYDAGRELDKLRQDMERQRIREQIDEDRKREENPVEVDEDDTSKTDDSDFKFLLTKVNADESEIITKKVLNEIAALFSKIRL